MTTRAVAVCIPTFNQAPYLAAAVISAATQVGMQVEVWISDDASADDTPSVASKLTGAYPNVKYLRQPTNQGIGRNCAQLLRMPKTDYIARLDSDDFYEPGYLAELVGVLAAEPTAAYAHCAVTEVNRDGQRVRERHLARVGGYQPPDEALQAATRGYRVAANILVFRRQALEAVGFYDAAMDFAEDWDLAIRLADNGWGNVYVPRLLANYRVWEDAAGYRAGRKIRELQGIRHVFESSLEAAYARRGWATGTLKRRRRAITLSQARWLAGRGLAMQEREQVEALLKALGDSWRLRISFRLARMGLGRWMMGLNAKNVAKSWLKSAVLRAR